MSRSGRPVSFTRDGLTLKVDPLVAPSIRARIRITGFSPKLTFKDAQALRDWLNRFEDWYGEPGP